MYKDNDRGDSGGCVIISIYQDISPKRCFKIVNFPVVDDIGRDYDSVPYYHFHP